MVGRTGAILIASISNDDRAACDDCCVCCWVVQDCVFYDCELELRTNCWHGENGGWTALGQPHHHRVASVAFSSSERAPEKNTPRTTDNVRISTETSSSRTRDTVSGHELQPGRPSLQGDVCCRAHSRTMSDSQTEGGERGRTREERTNTSEVERTRRRAEG